MSIAGQIGTVKKELDQLGIQLVVVSKTRTLEEIMEAYHTGHRVFGENLVQELTDKYETLPKDIQWHMIGHLQSNKVKYIAPFVSLIHAVDSLKLLQEINKHAQKHQRIIDCLLQVHIADEETKFGLDHAGLIELLRTESLGELQHIRITGLMGIATNIANEKVVREEFYELKTLFDGIRQSFFKDAPFFNTLSIGMSSDYRIAIEQGSTMVRLGSTIFGQRPAK